MRRAFTYTYIGLIILMLYVSNSVVAASFGDDYSDAFTFATKSEEILDADDGDVCSLGVGYDGQGYITVLFDNDFWDGFGTSDVIIYGLDVDSITEGYDVAVGNYINEFTPFTVTVIGSSDDAAGTVSFDMVDTEGTFNCIVLTMQEEAGSEGPPWPGAEIDAVWVRYTI